MSRTPIWYNTAYRVNLYVVSIVPCLAMMYETGRMVRIDSTNSAHASFDEPYVQVSDAGVFSVPPLGPLRPLCTWN